jgi:hypothetical protein
MSKAVVLLHEAHTALESLPAYVSKNRFVSKILYGHYGGCYATKRKPSTDEKPTERVTENSRKIREAVYAGDFPTC